MYIKVENFVSTVTINALIVSHNMDVYNSIDPDQKIKLLSRHITL